MKQIDPKTPSEYLEAIDRIVHWAQSYNLSVGDGINRSDDEDEATMTDIFFMLRGCADCALDNIANWHNVTRVLGAVK